MKKEPKLRKEPRVHKPSQLESPRWIQLIIDKRKWIEKIFIVLFILSALAACFVQVNYDLSEYLPEDVPTKQGLTIMEEEFGYPGTARVMIGEVSLHEAKIYKDQIAQVPGVNLVMWADTTTDMYQSELFIDYDTIEDYYKDGYAVMDIIFDGGDADKQTEKAIAQIEEITGDKGYMMGSAIQTNALSKTLMKEISVALVLGVIMVAIILAVTTTSWFEPVLFLMIMGVAIVINMGTNIFMGRVSFLTFSMAPILQLAIAMDYSVFLLHSFTWERDKGYEPRQALINAIKNSVSSILSSGATTVVGFLALMFMRFTIGFDMGFVLAKGIVISLLTVLLLMPALLMRWGDRIEKMRHKPFIPSFHNMGKAVYRVRFVALGLVLALVLPAFVAQGMNKFNYGNSALGAGPGTQVYADEQEINARFGQSNLILAIVPNEGNVREKEFTNEVQKLDTIKSALSLGAVLPEGVPEGILPRDLTGLLHTDEYSRVMIYVRSPVEGEFAFNCNNEIQEIMRSYYPENSYLVGLTPATQDIKTTITDDYNLVNLLSILGVALVIMITFRSLILPVVVIIPIEVAIFFNMALPYIEGGEMMYIGYIIVSCLQLGATVDYSILMTNNYLESRLHLSKRDSVRHAVSKSALSILTSGSILTIVGYGLYFISTVNAIADMGRLVGRGAFISMLLVLFLLPALLSLFDRWIFTQKRRERMRRQKGETDEEEEAETPGEECALISMRPESPLPDQGIGPNRQYATPEALENKSLEPAFAAASPQPVEQTSESVPPVEKEESR